MALNLAVLQRLDAKINKILATAGHVALYTFLPATQAWERKEVEGSLFVVERTEEPQHTLVVLNRISIENFCEPVIAGLQMRVSEPYLLLRNYKNETTGVWFYSKEEQQKIAQAVRALIDEKNAAKKSQKSENGAKAPAPSQAGPPGLSESPVSTSKTPESSPSASTTAKSSTAPNTAPSNVKSLSSSSSSSSTHTPKAPSPATPPSYAQAVTGPAASAPVPAIKTPSPAPALTVPASAPSQVVPAPQKQEQSPRDAHSSNAAGAALLNLLQPNGDRDRQRETSIAPQHPLAPHPLGPVPMGHLPPHLQPGAHPHAFPPHMQPHLQPPHLPPHFQPHLPHQPLMPHHPIRHPYQPSMPQQPQPPQPQPQPSQLQPQSRMQNGAPMPHTGQSLSEKQHLRAVLLSLVNDDNFIDQVYESYMKQLSISRSQA